MPSKKPIDVNAESVTEYEFYDADGRGFNSSPGETVGETVVTKSAVADAPPVTAPVQPAPDANDED